MASTKAKLDLVNERLFSSTNEVITWACSLNIDKCGNSQIKSQYNFNNTTCCLLDDLVKLADCKSDLPFIILLPSSQSSRCDD